MKVTELDPGKYDDELERTQKDKGVLLDLEMEGPHPVECVDSLLEAYRNGLRKGQPMVPGQLVIRNLEKLRANIVESSGKLAVAAFLATLKSVEHRLLPEDKPAEG